MKVDEKVLHIIPGLGFDGLLIFADCHGLALPLVAKCATMA